MKEADENKKFVEYLNGILKDFYTAAIPHFERKAYIQQLYDGDIPEDMWSTMSEIYIPMLRSAVLSAMSDIIEYTFPNTGFVSLRPRRPNVTYFKVKEFEKVLDDVMMEVMRIKRKAIPIIQDGIKFGAGYGIVEKTMITVEESQTFSIMRGSVKEGQFKKLGVNKIPRIVPQLRYIPYECVIPSPDASNPEDASCVIFIDYIREDVFRSMYQSQEASSEKIYLGNPEEIIQESRDVGIYDRSHPYFWDVMVMSGETTQTMAAQYRKIHEISMKNNTTNSYRMGYVCVAKYYFKNEHVWLANGKTIIYHDKDSYETLRCPIIKASPCLDSENWFALSDIAASRDVAMGVNMYHNAMFDLLSQYLRPTVVYDASKYGGSDIPRLQPWGVIPVNGKTTDAFGVVTPPPIAPGMLQVGTLFEQKYNAMNGDPINGQASPGMVRGGSNAFESLLQTTNGRRKMSSMIIDMGFIEPLIKNVLIHVQTLPQDTIEFVSLKDGEYVNNRVSLDDMRVEFDVKSDLLEKMRTSINDRMAEVTMYQQVYRDNPRINQEEALECVIGDRDKARRLIASEDQYKRNLEQLQALQNRQNQAQSTQAEQAAAGSRNESRP